MNRFSDGKPYYSLDSYFKTTYGQKCYKIALNAHMTCPNRDGKCGVRGCIFCSAGGSGEFAVDTMEFASIGEQIKKGLSLMRDKKTGDKFVAYFQAYTNTYAPTERLRKLFSEALSCRDVIGISIATRPDCLEDDVLSLFDELKRAYPEKFIWVELGLQSIHESTAEYIRRGYKTEVFDDAMIRLKAHSIPVIVHLIIGLPNETKDMLFETVSHVNALKPFGVKLQLLNVLKNTDLALDYGKGLFTALSKEEYIYLVGEVLKRLDKNIVIHRLTGDGKASDLIAPLFCKNKRDVLNSLHRYLKENRIYQGDNLNG